ncbi:MAG: alpha/beta hydrolase family protein [Pseudonocardiaceae bacterium]
MSVTTAAPPVDRRNFWFSPSGRRLACLAGHRSDRFWAEAWDLDGSPTWWPISGDTGETCYTQPLQCDDGRVLLARPVNGQHRVVLCSADSPRRTLATVDALGLRLIVSRTPGVLAYALITRSYSECELWRVRDSEPALSLVAPLPGLVASNEWLDADGRALGVSCLVEGASRPVLVDTTTGEITAIPGLAVGMRPLLYAPASGLLVVGRGTRDFGWVRYGRDEPVVFPAALRFDRNVSAWPLTFDPAGQRLLLLVEETTRSRLMIYHPCTDQVEALQTPVGVLGAVAHWRVEPDGTDLVRIPFSGPVNTVGLAELVVGGGFTVHGSTTVANADTAPHTEVFSGLAGPIEAVVWGSWRTSQDVLIALHGGPVGGWRLDHDPELQRLADAGLVIIAPNVRGGDRGPRDPETGRGAWGGPDLADIRHLARGIVAVTGSPLRVMGSSYGAYLALLAVGADPPLWSHCAALAPFVSVASLYPEAGPRVRALIERLDGRAEINDELGVRDARVFAARSTARLFVAHGSADAVIPVAQFHALRAYLTQHRAPSGPDPILVEVDGADHDLTDYDFTKQVRTGPEVSGRLYDFLTDGLARPAATPLGAAGPAAPGHADRDGDVPMIPERGVADSGNSRDRHSAEGGDNHGDHV